MIPSCVTVVVHLSDNGDRGIEDPAVAIPMGVILATWNQTHGTGRELQIAAYVPYLLLQIALIRRLGRVWIRSEILIRCAIEQDGYGMRAQAGTIPCGVSAPRRDCQDTRGGVRRMPYLGTLGIAVSCSGLPGTKERDHSPEEKQSGEFPQRSSAHR